MGRVARVGVVLTVILAALHAGAWPAGGAMVVGPPGLRADFDGDGFEDLAVGVPLEDHSGRWTPASSTSSTGPRAG